MQIKPKKHIYTATVACVLSVSAVEVNAQPTVYGHLHLSVDRFDSDGPDDIANQPDGFNIVSNSSRFGLRGSQDLGAGLSGVYQAEFGFNADESESTNQRNTFAGFAGNFGAVRVGRHDTPYKSSTGRLDPFSETVGDYNSIIGNTNVGRVTFDQRVSNQILYTSPNIGGFSLQAQYSVNPFEDGPTPDDVAQDNGADFQANTLISLAGTFSQGPLFVAVALEQHDFDLAPATNREGTKIGVGYELGGIEVGAVIEQLESDTSTAANNRDALWATVNGTFGQNQWAVAFGQAQDSDAAGADDGADFIAVGLFHRFTKTLRAYAAYAQVSNDDGGTYRLGDGGHGDVVSVAAGAEPNTLSFGVVADF